MFKNREKLLQSFADELKKIQNLRVSAIRVWFSCPEFKLAVCNIGEALDMLVNNTSTIHCSPENVRDNHGFLLDEESTEASLLYDISDAKSIVMESY